MPLLHTTTVRQADGSAALLLEGELDSYSSPQLGEELLALADEGVVNVSVDLAGVTFVDSGGLSVLLSSTKRFRADGGDLVIRSPRPGARRVFEMTGLNKVFTVVGAEAVPA